jgi:NAD(P)H dehydrogenase (quinone)
MRVLVIFAHPLPESFHAALHRDVLAALREAGHVVDDLDLYAEGFDPVLGAQERRDYHDLALNRAPTARYIERLLTAEALVLCFPVWTFGPPAILKGFFDRVLVPGVGFHLTGGGVKPGLTNLKTIAAVTSYGQTRLKAWYVGDPPRKLVTRYLRWQSGGCRVRYLARYDMNAATPTQLTAFRSRVRNAMQAL